MFVFIETPLFTRLAADYLSDDELSAVQQRLSDTPETGDLIPGSGGLRKMRWGASGRGKRGGVRIIYYARTRAGVIWLLTLYAKNEAENISTHTLRRIAKEIEDGQS